MDTDEFLQHGLESDDSDEGGSEDGDSSEEDTKAKSLPGKTKDNSKKSQMTPKEPKHKKSLEKLKESDPEFYEFLKNEDKELLDFDESEGSDDLEGSDDSEGGEESPNEASDEESGPHVHKLPKKLEVASDDSEAEDDDEADEAEAKDVKKKKTMLLSLKKISHWSQQLRTTGSLRILHEAVMAFKAAVRQAGADAEEGEAPGKYKVEGSAVFNAVIRLCLTDVLPVLNGVLKVPKSKDPKNPTLPSTSKKWKNVKNDVKSYLTDLIQLTSEMSEPAILTVLLKHVNQLVVYYACFPKLTKLLLKKLIVIWSSGEETSRVLAFLSINRMTIMKQASLLEFIIKQMYMAYVKNCKFTSPNTLPVINFMQRTLVEMFALDVHLTYQYAFVYIRQLAIHLRNAITVKKQETCQAVYNWQYIHSLELWAKLLSMLHPNPVLQPLIYPLTQTIIGTIKLTPTARYYPLRFHCIRALNTLALATHTFIPTLPFVLEVFQITDFNKKHKSLGFKPFNFACILKFSKAQLTEKSFRDGVIDQIYEHLLECLHVYSYSISFPELALPAVLQIKQFLKKCKVANYTRQMKQILDKVQETSKIISQRRRSATLNLADSKAIEAWEARSKEEGNPISKYYASWRKLRDRELQNEIAGKDRISVTELPSIDRPRGPRVATAEDRKEFSELFESDSEDSDDETRFLPKNERPKKKQKTKHGSGDDDDDSDDSAEYSDFDEDELEQLARSASEDDSDGDESGEGDDSGDDDEEGDDDDDDDEDGGAEEDDDSDIPDTEDVVEDFKMSDLDSD